MLVATAKQQKLKLLSHELIPLQALTEMVRQLRKGNGQSGLVLANGGVVTYQYVVCLSTQPRTSPYPDSNPLPAIITDVPVPTVDVRATGEAIIEVSSLPPGAGRDY